MDQWPSERAGRPPRVPLWHRRKRLPTAMLWGRTHADSVAAYHFQQSDRPIVRGGDHLTLLTEVEASRIRDLAAIESVFWLDPNQQRIEVTIPISRFTEYRVERYHHPGIKECDQYGHPTGYMEEQERDIQILVGREVENNRVKREWEHDFEEVPLWHFIEQGCLGSSNWRSRFAEFIAPK